MLYSFTIGLHQYIISVIKHFSKDPAGWVTDKIQYLTQPCVFVQDLETNSKCSLLIARDAGDISDTVVTIIGEAETVSYSRDRMLDHIM